MDVDDEDVLSRMHALLQDTRNQLARAVEEANELARDVEDEVRYFETISHTLHLK